MADSNTLAIGLAALLATIIALDVRTDLRRVISARNVVLIGILSWYLLEAIMLPPATAAYGQSLYNAGLLCVGLSMVSFLAAYHACHPRVPSKLISRFLAIERSGLLGVMFLVSLGIGLTPLIVLADFDLRVLLDGVGYVGKRWSGLGRGRYGGWRDAFLELQMFLKAAVPLAVAVVLLPRYAKWTRFIAALFLVWMFLRAVGSGTRTPVIMVGGPILAGVYWKLPAAWQRRSILLLPALFLLGYVFSAAMVISRGGGGFEWSASEQAEYVGNEMFREVLFISKTVPHVINYQYGYTYYVQAVNPIPRAIWPGKPIGDAGIQLARAYDGVDANTGDVYYTRSPGIIGEMYMNCGSLGIAIVSMLGGWIARWWDTITRVTDRSIVVFLLYCSGLSIFFVFGRAVYVPFLYGILSLVLLAHFASRKLAGVGDGRQLPDGIVDSGARGQRP